MVGWAGPNPAPVIPEALVLEKTRAELYEPDLSRSYSADHYESLVSRSVPQQAASDLAKRGLVAASLTVVEKDYVWDDVASRDESIILLGRSEQWVIGFAYRYLVDMNFPSKKLHKDGIFGIAGEPDWGVHKLSLFRKGKDSPSSKTFEVQRLPDGEDPKAADQNVAWYRPVGDHDAVVLYLSANHFESPVETIGLDNADVHLLTALDTSSQVFGLKFQLISPQSMKLLQSNVRPELTSLEMVAAGVVVAALVCVPLLGSTAATSGAGGAFLSESLVSSKIAASAFPFAFKLGTVGTDFLLDGGLQVRTHDTEGNQTLELLGVEIPVDDPEAVLMMTKFVNKALVEGQNYFVDFGKDASKGQVFVAAETRDKKMNLNEELLRHGLAKFDMDPETAKAFPELVHAAQDALREQKNLAADWRGSDYERQLESLAR